MKILVINGANMNLLGKREPDIYGREDYAALCARIYAHAQSRGLAVECFHSNHEGAIIDAIQEAEFRHLSVTAPVCIAQIRGHGFESYTMGIDLLAGGAN